MPRAVPRAMCIRLVKSMISVAVTSIKEAIN